MCYDMSYFSSIKLISDFLNITDVPEIEFTPTYHTVAQAYKKWPVAINNNGLQVKLFEWGLIADYMNTPEKIKQYRSSMANARSEKIQEDEKQSIWYKLQNQRCLVFTTGFFEHRDIGTKKKMPYFIKLKGEEIFCFAGLYNYNPAPNPETGELTGTFSILTRPANSLMQKIHNSGPNEKRMPAMLTKKLAMQWLLPALSNTEIKTILNYEQPADLMEAWPVNTIRTQKNDGPNVIAPSLELFIPPL
jgi:putative SOS response-associated peptidase YedK